MLTDQERENQERADRIRQEIAGAVIRGAPAKIPTAPENPGPRVPRAAHHLAKLRRWISALGTKLNLTQWLLIVIAGLLAVIVGMGGLAWHREAQRSAAEAQRTAARGRLNKSIADNLACIQRELNVASIW